MFVIQVKSLYPGLVQPHRTVFSQLKAPETFYYNKIKTNISSSPEIRRLKRPALTSTPWGCSATGIRWGRSSSWSG